MEFKKLRPWRPDSRNGVSGEPGAVHLAAGRTGMSRDNSKKDGQSQVITPAPIDVMRDTLATEIKPLWTGDDSKPFWSGDDDALFWGGGAEHARELKSRLLEAFSDLDWAAGEECPNTEAGPRVPLELFLEFLQAYLGDQSDDRGIHLLEAWDRCKGLTSEDLPGRRLNRIARWVWTKKDRDDIWEPFLAQE